MALRLPELISKRFRNIIETVASASPLVLPRGNIFIVTGTTNFNTINGGKEGQLIILYFQTGLDITTGGNISINNNLTFMGGEKAFLYYDGSNWIVISGSNIIDGDFEINGQLVIQDAYPSVSLDCKGASNFDGLFNAFANYIVCGSYITINDYLSLVGELRLDNVSEVASASIITLDDSTQFKITGTTDINTINTLRNRFIILRFTGVLTVKDSTGNIDLINGDFTTEAGSILVLLGVAGDKWYEISRSKQSTGSTFTDCCLKVTLDGNQAIGLSSPETIEFDDEIFDNGSNFNIGTYQFTAPANGFYVISVRLRIDPVTTASALTIDLYKNGSSVIEENLFHMWADYNHTLIMYHVLSLSASDTIEIRAKATGNTVNIFSGQDNSTLTIHKLNIT